MTDIYKRLNSAIELIEQNLFDEPDEKKLCQILELNSNVAGTIFELLTGFTLKDYIRKRRLSEAVALVQNEKIIDVAVLCGYDTREGFSRAFKAFHGQNPSKKLKNFNYLPKIVFKEKLLTHEAKKQEFLYLPDMTLYGEYLSQAQIKQKWKNFNENYLILTQKNGKMQYFVGNSLKQDSPSNFLPAATYSTCAFKKSTPDIIIFKKGKNINYYKIN